MPEPTLDMDAILNHGLDLSQNVSRFQDITMQEKSILHFDHDEDIGGAFDLALEKSAMHDDDGWNLDLGDIETVRKNITIEEDGDQSIEVGRDAGVEAPFSPNMTMEMDKSMLGGGDQLLEGFGNNEDTGFGNNEMVNMDYPDMTMDATNLPETPIASRILDLGMCY